MLAADFDLAAGVERLRPYGERYVKELSTTLLAADGPRAIGPLIDGLLAKAKAHAAVSETANIDEIGRHVERIYRTARGPVAILNDGRALAQVEQNFHEFRYITDYRVVYLDQDRWKEVTDTEDKRSFYLAAREPLERINAGLRVTPRGPFAKSTARRSHWDIGSLLGSFTKRSQNEKAAENQSPASGDDLTLISGLDARLARSLNTRGITRYGQIASWTPADVEHISAALGLKGLVRQENWIGQAKLLMPRYARCPECGHVYDAVELAACPRHLSPSTEPDGARDANVRPLETDAPLKPALSLAAGAKANAGGSNTSLVRRYATRGLAALSAIIFFALIITGTSHIPWSGNPETNVKPPSAVAKPQPPPNPTAEFPRNSQSESPVRSGSFTVLQGMDANGTVTETPFYTPSIGDCQDRCTRIATCGVFSYSKISKKCYLYRTATLSRNEYFDTGTLAKAATGAFAIAQGMRADGIELAGGIAYNSSPVDCESRCTRTPACTVFSYSAISRYCYLYGAATLKKSDSFVSGTRK